MPLIASALLAAAVAAADLVDDGPPPAESPPAAAEGAAVAGGGASGTTPTPPTPSDPPPSAAWVFQLGGGAIRLILPADIPVTGFLVQGAVERQMTGGWARGKWLELGLGVSGGRTEAGLPVRDLHASALLWSGRHRIVRAGAGVSAGLFSFRRATTGHDERASVYGLAAGLELTVVRWRTGAAFARVVGVLRAASGVDDSTETFHGASLLVGARFGSGVAFAGE